MAALRIDLLSLPVDVIFFTVIPPRIIQVAGRFPLLA